MWFLGDVHKYINNLPQAHLYTKSMERGTLFPNCLFRGVHSAFRRTLRSPSEVSTKTACTRSDVGGRRSEVGPEIGTLAGLYKGGTVCLFGDLSLGVLFPLGGLSGSLIVLRQRNHANNAGKYRPWLVASYGQN